MPQGPGGRPLAFIAVNGHGAYPVAGTIPRIFYAVRSVLALQLRLPGMYELMLFMLERVACSAWCDNGA